jgi:type I restriction enzyme, S subunit
MGSEWREVRLSELANEITVGHVGPMPPYVADGIPFLRSQNVDRLRINDSDLKTIDSSSHDRLRKSALRPGDVVIVRTGRPGACAVIPPSLPAANCSDLVIIRCGRELDPWFLAYYINSAALHGVSSQVVGAVQQHFNIGSARDLTIRLPDLTTQREVVEILRALDDKIELNRGMSQTLESMARALFKSWFVDFDPVRAKAEGFDLTLPDRIADLFPASFEDSDIGPIPLGWRASTLGEMVEVNPSRTLRDGHLAPYLDMANAPTTGHSPGNVVDRVFRSGSRFMNGDTLVARITPCLENGKTAFVDFLPEGQVGWGSTEFLVLRPKSPVPPELAYCLARSEPLREYAIQNMSGTSGRQRVSAEALSRYSLVRPPDSVAMAFGSASARLLGRAKLANDECNTLSEQRDSLLPRLISGNGPRAA